MELRMNQYQLPDKVGFNYEELKTELQAKVSQYESLIYSDEQIKDAKADKAQLNKLKKALNDERIRLQKEYMIPFNEFKAKIDELIGIIDKPVGLIDKQVREYEEQKKAEKQNQIQEYWDRVTSPDHPLELHRVMDARWLNSSTSMKSIQEEINGILSKYAEDITTLRNLPEFAFEAEEVYKSTLDLGRAVNESHRLSEQAKRKAEYEAEQERERLKELALVPENPADSLDNPPFPDAREIEGGHCVPFPADAIKPPELPTAHLKETAEWISFRALLTVEQAKELKRYFDDNNIIFEAI